MIGSGSLVCLSCRQYLRFPPNGELSDGALVNAAISTSDIPKPIPRCKNDDPRNDGIAI
jgi:hypothetical protein